MSALVAGWVDCLYNVVDWLTARTKDDQHFGQNQFKVHFLFLSLKKFLANRFLFCFSHPTPPWVDKSCLQLNPALSKLLQRPAMRFVVFRHAGRARLSWVWSAVLSTAYCCGHDCSYIRRSAIGAEARGVCQRLRTRPLTDSFWGNTWYISYIILVSHMY